MLEDRPYPNEIRAAWTSVVDSMSLPSSEATLIMNIVDYVQPPMSLEAFGMASKIYAADHELRVDESLVDRLSRAPKISSSAPYQPGTHYPVYFAMTNPAKLGKKFCPSYQKSRKIISEIFHDASPKKEASRNKFYQHVVDIRDVIIAIIKSGWHPVKIETSDKKDFLEAAHRDAMYSQRIQLGIKKMETFDTILEGKLLPGERLRDFHGYSRGERGEKNLIKQDIWHDEYVTRLAKKSIPERISMKYPSDCFATASHADSDFELKQVDIHQRLDSEAKREGEEASESVTLQRGTPSSQTPRDDRTLIRSWLAGSQTSSIQSVTDLSRLTPDQVQQVMEAPLTPLCRLFAALLISTGLPPARLTRLTKSTDLAVVVGNAGDDRPHWLPDQHLLCYRLLDGPTSRDSDPSALWVMLQLPPAMAACLNEHRVAPGERPLRRTRDQLNRQLRRHFAIAPGITPTANRLRATGWLYSRQHAIDDVAAATLSGQFGLGLSAPAAYRQLSRNEIQRVFGQTLKDIGWRELTSAPLPPPQVSSTSQGIDSMGSAIALPPEAFIPLFQELRNAMSVPSADLSRWWSGQPLPLEALASLHQLVSAHELLAWQLSTGARPLGHGSKQQLGNGLQWVHDKNSARGKESRVIPLLKSVHDSLHALHSWTDDVIYRLPTWQIRLDDQRTRKCQTPSWLQFAPCGRRLILRDMHWRDLAAKLSNKIDDLPSNITRHSTASWLRHHVADAEVDSLLGHARHGRMLSSPHAETSMGQQHHLRNALTKWLKKCGYRPLKWGKLAW